MEPNEQQKHDEHPEANEEREKHALGSAGVPS